MSDGATRRGIVIDPCRAYHNAGLTIIFAGGRGDHHAGLGRGPAAQLPDEPSDTRIARGEAVIVDEVLPDGHGIPTQAHGVDNELAVGLARTRGRRAFRWG